MYRHLEQRLVEHLREFLRRAYGLEDAKIVVEQPPKIEFGEYALPLAFDLAKKASQGSAEDCRGDCCGSWARFRGLRSSRSRARDTSMFVLNARSWLLLLLPMSTRGNRSRWKSAG